MSSIPSLVPRDRYAALERCTYFNQAALGLIPVPGIDAMETFLRQTAQFGNLYLSDDQETAILDGVRSAGAGVLATGTRVDAARVAERRTRSAPASSWTRRSWPAPGSSTPSGAVQTRW
jgi:hypothetical protein